jgi:hypothetical protein
LARHVDNNDDINETWTLLKNVITQTAGVILNRTKRVTHTQIGLIQNVNRRQLIKTEHIDSRKAVEEYRTARSEEKRVHKQKDKI